MEKNPHYYDRQPAGIAPQYPVRPPQGAAHKKRPPQKMPKAQAQELADKLKRGFAVSSILGFGAFSGLVALHQVSTTTTTQASTSVSAQSSSSNKSISKQQGGNNLGTSTPTATATNTPTPTATDTPTPTNTFTPGDQNNNFGPSAQPVGGSGVS